MKPYEEALEQIATAVYVATLPSAIVGGTQAVTNKRRAAVAAVETAKYLIEEIDKSEEIRTKKAVKRSKERGWINKDEA